MGVKDLWSVISPVCEKMSLWELRDKRIAVDLSAWVCDSQHFASGQRNMYLRNLFFRTSYLLLSGVEPIFVLEGSAPDIKKNTIRKRMNKNPKADDEKAKTVRSRLTSLQKQCAELLSMMGLSCVQAPGEAEAFCAQLNQANLVYGVITQDSDAFLYGAKKVFRNFQLGPSYTCDVYQADLIESKLGLSRTKLIAFSLITGCDYTKGINKAGKESAMKFIKTIPDDEIFKRFESWKNSSLFSNLEKNKYSMFSNIEMTIRNKAIQDKDFPNMQVVHEYLTLPEKLSLSYSWSLPSIPKFISLAVRKLGWEEEYAEKKFLPLVTRWHLVNNGAECGLIMKEIVKKRNIKGIHGFDVSWNIHDYITTEDRHLVESVYPQLVQQYELLTKKPVKEKKNGKRKRKENEEGTTAKRTISETDASEAKHNETKKSKITIEKYLQNYDEPHDLSLCESSFIYDENDLNLSSIVESVVSRTDSNPALKILKSLNNCS